MLEYNVPGRNMMMIINNFVLHQREVAMPQASQQWPMYGYRNRCVLVMHRKLQFTEWFLIFYLRCNIFLYLLLMVFQIEMYMCKK